MQATCSLGERRDPVEQVLLARHAGDLVTHLSVLEEEQGRDRANIVAKRQALATLTVPAFSFAISSRIGAIILHGPHHSAQKSTSTGCALFITSWSKFDSSIVTAVPFSMSLLKKISPELNEQG